MLGIFFSFFIGASLAPNWPSKVELTRGGDDTHIRACASGMHAMRHAARGIALVAHQQLMCTCACTPARVRRACARIAQRARPRRHASTGVCVVIVIACMRVCRRAPKHAHFRVSRAASALAFLARVFSTFFLLSPCLTKSQSPRRRWPRLRGRCEILAWIEPRGRMRVKPSSAPSSAARAAGITPW